MLRAKDGFSADATLRVVGITYRQLDYWDKTGLIRPSIQRAKGKGSRRIYSFGDLVELRVVGRLLSAGVPLPSVRKAARYLRLNLANVSRPLARLALTTDGKRVLVRTTDGRHLMDATAGGQVVVAVAVAPIVRDLEDRVTELRAPRSVKVRVRGETYVAVLTPALEAGGFSVEVPSLPGVVTEGDTLQEARKMVAEAISLWLDAPSSRRASTP